MKTEPAFGERRRETGGQHQCIQPIDLRHEPVERRGIRDIALRVGTGASTIGDQRATREARCHCSADARCATDDDVHVESPRPGQPQ